MSHYCCSVPRGRQRRGRCSMFYIFRRQEEWWLLRCCSTTMFCISASLIGYRIEFGLLCDPIRYNLISIELVIGDRFFFAVSDWHLFSFQYATLAANRSDIAGLYFPIAFFTLGLLYTNCSQVLWTTIGVYMEVFPRQYHMRCIHES